VRSKLTSENLSRMDDKSQRSKVPSKAPSKKSVKSSKKAKPAWATTEKQAEDVKEAEIDDLLEFAYELDYDAYMDDFEVRQLFSIIKDRVTEIKQDKDWKENIAQEWNQAAEAEQVENKSQTKSVFSYSKSPYYLLTFILRKTRRQISDLGQVTSHVNEKQS
jgi:hypothetical protein